MGVLDAKEGDWWDVAALHEQKGYGTFPLLIEEKAVWCSERSDNLITIGLESHTPDDTYSHTIFCFFKAVLWIPMWSVYIDSMAKILQA